MQPCIVCHNEVNTANSPGLKTYCCGQVQCETCMAILAEHCAVCDRGLLNRQVPCFNCGADTRMHESRCCIACEELCCVNCSVKDNCCVDGRSGDVVCVHAVCDRC